MVSVLIPTVGRRSVLRALESVVFDPAVTEVVVAKNLHPLVGWKGKKPREENRIRNYYGFRLRGPWVLWLDDDDYLLPGRLTEGLKEAPSGSDVLLFDVKLRDGRVVPGDIKEPGYGTVDGTCLVTRTSVLSHTPWPLSSRYEADWLFYQDLLEADVNICRVPHLLAVKG